MTNDKKKVLQDIREALEKYGNDIECLIFCAKTDDNDAISCIYGEAKDVYGVIGELNYILIRDRMSTENLPYN